MKFMSSLKAGFVRGGEVTGTMVFSLRVRSRRHSVYLHDVCSLEVTALIPLLSKRVDSRIVNDEGRGPCSPVIVVANVKEVSGEVFRLISIGKA